jgi:hypothetical protein
MAETSSPDTPSNVQSSIDVPSIDAYVSSLIASGAVTEGQFYKWTTPSGEVYYGPNPRRQRTTIPRTQLDPLPGPITQDQVTEVENLVRQLQVINQRVEGYGDAEPGAIGNVVGLDPIGFVIDGEFRLSEDTSPASILEGMVNALDNKSIADFVNQVGLWGFVISPSATIAGKALAALNADQIGILADAMNQSEEVAAMANTALDAMSNDQLNATINSWSEVYTNAYEMAVEATGLEFDATSKTDMVAFEQRDDISQVESMMWAINAAVQVRDGTERANRIGDGSNPDGAAGPNDGVSQGELNSMGLGHLSASRQGGWHRTDNMKGFMAGGVTNENFPGAVAYPGPPWDPGTPFDNPEDQTYNYPGTDLSGETGPEGAIGPMGGVEDYPEGFEIDDDVTGPTVETTAAMEDIGTKNGDGENGDYSMEGYGGWDEGAGGASYFHEGGLINKNNAWMGGEDSTGHNYKPLADVRPMLDEGGMVKKPSYQAGGKVKPLISPYAAFQNRANQQTRQMMQPKQLPGQRPQPMAGQPRQPSAKGAQPRQPSAKGVPQAGSNVDITAKKGEFIIPVDVVKIKGTEFFEKAISGARKTHFEATGRRNVQKQKRVSKNISRFDPNAPKSRRNPFGLPKIAGATPSPGTPPVKPKVRRPVPGVRPTSPVTQQPINRGSQQLRQPILS